MKNRLYTVFFTLLLFILMAFPAFAAGDMPRLVDEAGLLTGSEERELLNKLNEISERQQLDIVIVTVNSLKGASAMEYADDFYDGNGYGFGYERDGILFLINMEERDWYMSTSGFGITAFTDAGLEYLSGKILSDLSNGDYAQAFTTFAGMCDDYITQAKTGKPYDVHHLPKEPLRLLLYLAAALITGFVTALIITGMMRSKLKSVHGQTAAGNYVRNGSLKLTTKKDLYLYRHVTRREKPKQQNTGGSGSTHRSGGSTTHRSSSGRSHGGRGGKF